MSLCNKICESKPRMSKLLSCLWLETVDCSSRYLAGPLSLSSMHSWMQWIGDCSMPVFHEMIAGCTFCGAVFCCCSDTWYGDILNPTTTKVGTKRCIWTAKDFWVMITAIYGWWFCKCDKPIQWYVSWWQKQSWRNHCKSLPQASTEADHVSAGPKESGELHDQHHISNWPHHSQILVGHRICRNL